MAEKLVEPFEELVGGCFSKSIWDQMCANMPDLENATLEEIEALLDPEFVPEGWLDPPLLQRRSSNCLSPRRQSLQVSCPHRKLADLLLQSLRKKSVVLVLVFPKLFSIFLASTVALSAFTSLKSHSFWCFLLLLITVVHCYS